MIKTGSLEFVMAPEGWILLGQDETGRKIILNWITEYFPDHDPNKCDYCLTLAANSNRSPSVHGKIAVAKDKREL